MFLNVGFKGKKKIAPWGDCRKPAKEGPLESRVIGLGTYVVSGKNLNDPCLSGFVEGRRNGWKLEQNVAFSLTITNRSTKKVHNP